MAPQTKARSRWRKHMDPRGPSTDYFSACTRQHCFRVRAPERRLDPLACSYGRKALKPRTSLQDWRRSA
eukprot:scaffold19331_cov30-Phaeocystis_antarctica.AAC.2